MSSGAESVVPRHPSNRRIIEQMKSWGWEEGKSNGNWLTMWAPPVGDMAGHQLKVRPATQHDANPTSTFLRIYELTTGGNAERFWRGPSATWLRMVVERKEEIARTRREIAKRELEAQATKAAMRAAGQAPAAVAPAPVIQPEKALTKKEVGALMAPQLSKYDPNIDRFPRDAVLEHVLKAGKPLKTAEVIAAFGADPADRGNQVMMNNRLNNLVLSGRLTRVGRGTFTAPTPERPTAPAPAPAPTPPPAPTPAPTPAPEPEPEPTPPEKPTPVAPVRRLTPVAQVSRAAASMDDTIEAVLDLLLPDGFKASHLRYIAPWIDATKAMVTAVGGD